MRSRPDSSRMTTAGLVVLMIALATSMLGPSPAVAQSDGTEVRVQRVGGVDRYETAALTALEWQYGRCARRWEIYADSEQECRDDAIISREWTLVRGDSFADALAAASYAQAPILTTPATRLPSYAGLFRDRLINSVSLIGGPDVISDDVQEDLRDQFGYGGPRIAAFSRYGTAVEVAISHRSAYGDSSFPFEEIIIVNGDSWPDGLTAAALVGPLRSMRVVLPVERDRVPGEVYLYLRSRSIVEPALTQLTIVGGTAVVSDEVVAELEAITPFAGTRRLAGSNRFETARAVADAYFENDAIADEPWGVTIIRPDTFADAIAAPNIIQAYNAPLLLAQSNTELGVDNEAWIAQHQDNLFTATLLGTPDVLSDNVLTDTQRALCTNRPECEP